MTVVSLKKRYTSKLFANLVALGINLITQVIIPRALGPKAYGDFHFLSNFFSQLMPFFSLSSSIGFYTKVSQRQNDFKLVSFYFQFTLLIFIVLILFVAGSQLTGLSNFFWVDQNISYVYMATFFSILIWSIQILNQLADAYALTVSTEIAKIFQKTVGLILILIIFFSNYLDLEKFFFYHYTIQSLLIIIFTRIIIKNKSISFEELKISVNEIRLYAKEFYQYSHPLFIYTVIGMLIGIIERWMLQKYGGSIQQGFFSLSYQIGGICFIFTSAMTSLITREFSIAHSVGNIKEMSRLFRRYVPLLYSIAAYFCCFACVQSSKIAYIFGGSKFEGAALPMMVMALYPIHQTYGQLTGSIYYATGQTKLYRNIGLIQFALSLPLVYFLLAPSNSMGMSLGAIGLSIKFVVIQFLGVNIALYFNSKLLNLNFIRYFIHQIICVLCLFVLAFVSKIFINNLGMQDEIIISFILSGFIYSCFVIIMMWFFPMIFGLKHDDLIKFIKSGKSFIKCKK